MNDFQNTPSRDERDMPRLLDQLSSPADVAALDDDALARLAGELRQEIIAVTSRNGGHLAPS